MKSVFLLLVIVALILCFKCIPQITTNKESQEKCKLCVGIGIFLVVVYICTNDTIEGIEAGTEEEAEEEEEVEGEEEAEKAYGVNEMGDANNLPAECNGIKCSIGAPGRCLDTTAQKCSGNEPNDKGQCPPGFVNCSGGGGDNPDPEHNSGDKPDPEHNSGDKGKIQIKNSTQKTMYVFFVSNGNTSYTQTGPPSWTIVNNPNNTSINKANMTFYHTVAPNETLGFNGTADWISVTAVVSSILPNPIADFDYAGMTLLEWTFTESNKHMDTDVSNAKGGNAEVNINIANSTCPNDVNSCEIDYSVAKENNLITRPQGIPRIDITGLDINEDMCKNYNNGTSNCRDCGTGKDNCTPPYTGTSSCVSDNIKERWGCYQWWGNPNNEAQKLWRQIFKNCPFYQWAYDEFGIQVPQNYDYTHTYPISCGTGSGVCDDYANSNIYKCMTGGKIGEGCNPNELGLTENYTKPLKSCILNKDSHVIFNITSIYDDTITDY